MRISDWSSDVCSSDLQAGALGLAVQRLVHLAEGRHHLVEVLGRDADAGVRYLDDDALRALHAGRAGRASRPDNRRLQQRSEEHTSELQSLMRISYAVFCLKKKNNAHPLTLTYVRTHITQDGHIHLHLTTTTI